MEQHADASEPALTVTVVRSGGFAGIKRTWEAEAHDSTTAELWSGLVESLPWGQAPQHDPQSADRFVYRIVIVIHTEVRHQVILPESELTGGWRELVDRVQKESDAAGTIRPPGAL